jgi:hypothetical protein
MPEGDFYQPLILAYHAASEDFRFERDEFSKMLSVFSGDFHTTNKRYDEVYKAISQAGSQHQNKLRAICDQIIT